MRGCADASAIHGACVSKVPPYHPSQQELHGSPLGIGQGRLSVNPSDADGRDHWNCSTGYVVLHGCETPERVAEVKARYGLP